MKEVIVTYANGDGAAITYSTLANGADVNEQNQANHGYDLRWDNLFVRVWGPGSTLVIPRDRIFSILAVD